MSAVNPEKNVPRKVEEGERGSLSIRTLGSTWWRETHSLQTTSYLNLWKAHYDGG